MKELTITYTKQIKEMKTIYRQLPDRIEELESWTGNHYEIEVAEKVLPFFLECAGWGYLRKNGMYHFRNICDYSLESIIKTGEKTVFDKWEYEDLK